MGSVIIAILLFLSLSDVNLTLPLYNLFFNNRHKVGAVGYSGVHSLHLMTLASVSHMEYKLFYFQNKRSTLNVFASNSIFGKYTYAVVCWAKILH